MTPSNMSKDLEDRISGLLASLAVTNQSVMNLTELSKKHETLLYGSDAQGGLVSRNVENSRILKDHDNTLERLEKSCEQVVSFMVAQVEENKAQRDSNRNLNRVVLGLAAAVFFILLLIGVSDINALHTLLSNIHW